MFILEALIKYLKKDHFNEVLEEHDRTQAENMLSYIPLEEDLETQEDLNCEHLFMPIDSTGEILACSKCGQLCRKKDLKKKNIFRT